MEDKKEDHDHDSLCEKPLTAGEKFIKKLREMPYEESKVGQAFVILQKKHKGQKKSSSDEK
jgi:hypothetical protein